MLKNKKFARYAIAFNLLGIVFNFMYSGLQNDQINISRAFPPGPMTSPCCR